MVEAQTPIILGVVIGAFGLRGEVVIKITGDDPETLGRYPSVQVTTGGLDVASSRRLDIEWCRAQKGRAIIRFRGDAHREEAEARVGSTLWLPRSELLPTEDGRCYFVDLIGLEVVTTEGSVLGRVREMLENPANDLFVVDVGGREVLIPNVDAIVKEIDLPGRRLVIDPLPGLLDI